MLTGRFDCMGALPWIAKGAPLKVISASAGRNPVLAIRMVDWQTAVEIFDGRDDYGEDRWVAFGFIGVALYVMAYTERGDTLRIISPRGVTKKEEKIYA